MFMFVWWYFYMTWWEERWRNWQCSDHQMGVEGNTTLKSAEISLWQASFPFHLKNIQHCTWLNISSQPLSGSMCSRFEFNTLRPVHLHFHSFLARTTRLRYTTRSAASSVSFYKPEHGHHHIHQKHWLEQEIQFKLIEFPYPSLSISGQFGHDPDLLKGWVHSEYMIMWSMVIWYLLFVFVHCQCWQVFLDSDWQVGRRAKWLLCE
jgi:hypothetical protein